METLNINNKSMIVDDSESFELNSTTSLELNTWEKERSDEDLDNFLASRLGALGLSASDFELVA